MDDFPTFREAFIREVDARGLKFARVARDAGVSVHILKNMRNRPSTKINVEAAMRLAEALGVTIEHLVQGEGMCRTAQVPEATEVERRMLSLFDRLNDDEKEGVIASIRKLIEFGDAP